MARVKLGALILTAAILAGALAFIGLPRATECSAADAACQAAVKDNTERCKPSVNIITIGNDTRYVKMRITIARKGDECITTEEIIEDHDSNFGLGDMTGYNASCNISMADLARFGHRACQGSIYDFVVPVVGGGGSGGGTGGARGSPEGFGGGTPQDRPPKIYCTVDDMPCQEMVAGLINNCTDAEIEASELISYSEEIGMSYITSYIQVMRGSECSIYYKVLNIVNLPPNIPPEVMGMDMTCSAPLSQFPRVGIDRGWCSGGLIQYFDVLYYGS